MCRVASLALSALVWALGLGGCARPVEDSSAAAAAPAGLVPAPSANSAPADGAEARRAELLQRIRAADPRKQTIERALLNEKNELGLVLGRRVDLDEVPKLLRAMLAQLDTAFPGQDHVVVAYTPTNPPRVIGSARLDSRTRDMTYTPASPSP